ncbi:MAG: rRNA maturation RNase YbeY [Candidatus Eisenbacteria bacterium]|uniref:Endoribonuclease YbeY n=1 Tax=Eiseniibacteriota bacterium TaxID=2212470 RepID=A0A538TVR9_UNCEI|nr:MAG: rRNA maturation RNase YbeY [Candidatus Eisenbacteria bacterium]
MPISVASRHRARGLAVPLRALVRMVLAGEGRRPGEIGIVLADDLTLRRLNHRHRGIDRATDVLSFGYEDGSRAGVAGVSGDIVISLERMVEQSRRYRVSRGRELARLVIHGALHLAGLDHQRAAERRVMRRREERALEGSRGAIRALDRSLRLDR